MKKLSGFSLMEMMIVLLIVSVIAGATAPMINKKLMTAASEKSPWVWIGKGTTDIGYNVLGKTNTAAIGTLELPNDTPTRPPRLYVHTDDARMNPLLSFKGPNSNRWDMTIAKNSLYLSNNLPNSDDYIAVQSLSIGSGAISTGNYAIALGAVATGAGDDSIAIGSNSTTFDDVTVEGADSAIALGANSQATGEYGIAIGGGNSSTSTSTRSWNSSSIAIGRGTDALGENSIAMGYNAAAGAYDANGNELSTQPMNAIAIGHGAKAKNGNSIAMGSDAVAGTEPDQNNTSAIAIGHNSQATGEYGIAIGGGNISGPTQTRSWNSSSIAIGRGTGAYTDHSIAIGYNAAAGNNGNTETKNAIAIGHEAKATASGSLAIGSSGEYTYNGFPASKDAPLANHACSVAIGPGAVTTKSNQIVLGDSTTTVYIPGKLAVQGNVYLGGDSASRVWIRGSEKDSNTYNKLYKYLIDNPGLNLGIRPDVESEHYIENFANYTSDRRLKNVGKAFKGGLEEIKKLEVFNYTFKKDKSKTPRVGVMAQDLEKIFPSAVTKGEDGFLRIRMEDMFYALVNAVKELDTKFDLLAQKQKKIDELEDKVSKLELENKEFAKRLLELEKKIK